MNRRRFLFKIFGGFITAFTISQLIKEDKESKSINSVNGMDLFYSIDNGLTWNKSGTHTLELNPRRLSTKVEVTEGIIDLFS